MNGIDDEVLQHSDLEEGSVKRAIIEMQKTYILADDSKLGVTSFVKSGSDQASHDYHQSM